MPQATRQTVTVASAAQLSSVWNPLKLCLFTMVHLPTRTAGVVTLQLSVDGGSNFAVVLGDDGESLTVAASATTPAWRDISDYIRAVMDDDDVQLRIDLGTNQGAERTITILQRED